jgi:hypothetical protein
MDEEAQVGLANIKRQVERRAAADFTSARQSR